MKQGNTLSPAPGNNPKILLLFSSMLFSLPAYNQCIVLPNAVPGISYTYIQTGGTNASGIAYNPNANLYYAVIAGNPGFPYETFDVSGISLYQTIAGFDFRGLWWNANTGQLEGNGYATSGLWSTNLDANSYALSTGFNIFTGQNQPDIQSCGDYDYDADEIIYYFNGAIYRVSRPTNTFLGSYPITGCPVPLFNLNTTSIAYTGCAGREIALEDYVNKTILLFDKSTGAYSCSSQLPTSAVTNNSFRFSYAHNMVWLYDVYLRTWTSYSIFQSLTGGTSSLLGSDTLLCEGDSLVLNAGSSFTDYVWSTGSTDSSIVITDSGSYWLTVTNGACQYSDTIVIADTACSPLLAFIASDTAVCEKFCIEFSDASQNNPFQWLWFFQGGIPPSSGDQNPVDICYNLAGVYDVTLITTSSTGIDTLYLQDYITVFATPPLPSITQNGYELTCSPANAYQWQFNLVDIPGATSQVYTATQSGLYTVLVYDANSCVNSASINIEIVGVQEPVGQVIFSVYPNPSNGIFTVYLSNLSPGTPVSFHLENSLGQKIYSLSETSYQQHLEQEIRLDGISKGIYLLRLTTGDNYFTRKILIHP